MNERMDGREVSRATVHTLDCNRGTIVVRWENGLFHGGLCKRQWQERRECGHAA